MPSSNPSDRWSNQRSEALQSVHLFRIGVNPQEFHFKAFFLIFLQRGLVLPDSASQSQMR